MDIVEIEWAEGAREKVITKHQLDPEEVEDSLFEPGVRVQRGHSGRYLLWAQTPAGAYVLVVFEYNKGTAVVLTARRMTEAERRRFREWK
jgi:uncharacterized DUF497 family protein